MGTGFCCCKFVEIITFHTNSLLPKALKIFSKKNPNTHTHSHTTLIYGRDNFIYVVSFSLHFSYSRLFDKQVSMKFLVT